MHKYLQWLFFFEKFEIQTKLSKQAILQKIEPFTREQYDGYTGRLRDNGFVIAQKPYSYSGFLRTRNSLAPIAEATITEADGITTVSGLLRPHRLVQCCLYSFFLPLILLTLFAGPFPLIIEGIFYFCFFRPAHQLLDTLKELLCTDDTTY